MRAGCVLALVSILFSIAVSADDPGLQVGFGESDITPDITGKPVYLAGFGKNRKASRVHDPLKARALVLADGKKKIALISVDVIGLFHSSVERVRKRLPAFDYVLVSSTHNHNGPDTLGLWGPNPVVSGIDRTYLARLEDNLVEAVRRADGARRPVSVRIGSARDPDLLHDARLPIVKHDELVALQFLDRKTGRCAGIVVQWNCHPETLGSQNTEITADFVAAVVQQLQESYRSPVVYFTGTVGGLMTSLQVPVKSEDGTELKDGTFEKTERYGRLVGKLAERALSKATALSLTPMRVAACELYLPLDNKLYMLAWKLGVLDRPAYVWHGDPARATLADANVAAGTALCVKTELAYLRLGELSVAAIPAEIYPELVLVKVQEPADAGADFPRSPAEPAIYAQMPGPYRMIVGLANDELGYIIPKRQWDEKPPFCYGRKSSQYGEVNSLGPETAPILCRAFRQLAKQVR